MKTLIILLLAIVGIFSNLQAQIKYHPYYLGFTPNAEKIVLIGATGIADMFVEVYDVKTQESQASFRISSFEYGIHYVLPSHVYLSDAYAVIERREGSKVIDHLVYDIATGEQVTNANKSKELAGKVVALRKNHPQRKQAEGVLRSHIVLNEGRFVAQVMDSRTLSTRLNIHDHNGKKIDSKVIPVRRGDVYALSHDATLYAYLEPGAIKVFRFDLNDIQIASIPIAHQNLSKGIVGLVELISPRAAFMQRLMYLSKSSFKEIRSETKDPKAPFGSSLTCYESSYTIMGATKAWVCQDKKYNWIYAAVFRSGKNDVRESLDFAKKSANTLLPMLPDSWNVSTSNEKAAAGVIIHHDVTHDGSKKDYPSFLYSSFRSNKDNNNNYTTNVYFFVYPEER